MSLSSSRIIAVSAPAAPDGKTEKSSAETPAALEPGPWVLAATRLTFKNVRTVRTGTVCAIDTGEMPGSMKRGKWTIELIGVTGFAVGTAFRVLPAPGSFQVANRTYVSGALHSFVAVGTGSDAARGQVAVASGEIPDLVNVRVDIDPPGDWAFALRFTPA